LSYVRYVADMFWPHHMAAFYPLEVRTISIPQGLLCCILVTGLTILFAWLGRRHRYLITGWLWFVIALIPVIGLVQAGSQAMADRYTYIPYIGLFVMFAWAAGEFLSRWPQTKFAIGVLAAIVLMAQTVIARQQASYWHDSVKLFSHAIDVTHNNYIAHNHRGVAYNNQGEWALAKQDFIDATRINPTYAEAFNNLGVTYSRLGQWDDAIGSFQRAIKAQADYAEGYNNMGITYGKVGRWELAAQAFKQACAVKTGYDEAARNLGFAAGKLGHWQEAIDAYKYAISIRPEDTAMYLSLGAAYKEMGRKQESVDSLSRAAELAPGNAEVRQELADELVLLGARKKAIEQYKAVLRIKPDWAKCLNNLAFVMSAYPDAADADLDEAVIYARRACDLTSNAVPAYVDTLAVAYAAAGRFGDAAETARKAMKIAGDSNDLVLFKDIDRRLSLYLDGKPYVELVSRSQVDAGHP
jgi:protein O-mannosyl-transferase